MLRCSSSRLEVVVKVLKVFFRCFSDNKRSSLEAKRNKLTVWFRQRRVDDSSLMLVGPSVIIVTFCNIKVTFFLQKQRYRSSVSSRSKYIDVLFRAISQEVFLSVLKVEVSINYIPTGNLSKWAKLIVIWNIWVIKFKSNFHIHDQSFLPPKFIKKGTKCFGTI